MQHEASAGAEISRRGLLRWGLAAALATSPLPLWAGSAGTAKRKLSFINLHTGETLSATYWAKGKYQRQALRDINQILRDFRTGDVHTIDPRLLDLLHEVQLRLKSRAPFEIISGYRSPATNATLAAASDGVAKKSYHLRGMAVDVRLQDRSLKGLRNAARKLAAGGVGYYPRSGFVHLDIGPPRDW